LHIINSIKTFLNFYKGDVSMIQSHRLVAKDTEKAFETEITGITEPLYQVISKKSTPALSHRELNENFDTFLETKK